MSRTILFVMGLLFISSASYAFDINFENYSTYSNDYKIKEINEIRAQVISSSYGGRFRRDCYREYHSNFPYAAQTVSYMIKQNLDSNNLEVKLPSTVSFNEVIELAKHSGEKLDEEINWGCKVKTYLTGMVKGVTVEGHKFKSDFFMDFSGHKVGLRVGSYTVNVDTDHVTTSDLIPTAFMGQSWDNVWKELDPAVSNSQTNF